MSKKIKKFFIPDAPEVEEPLKIRRDDLKYRKTWTRNPAEQIVPNKKKNFNEQKFSNKGNFKKYVENELDDFDEEA